MHDPSPLDVLQVSLARAARTDAGVHAAGNVVSLKMINSIPELEEAGMPLISHINSFLPPQIRVWEILRTTNNFKWVVFSIRCRSHAMTEVLPISDSVHEREQFLFANSMFIYRRMT